jgi:hypothetical protein
MSRFFHRQLGLPLALLLFVEVSAWLRAQPLATATNTASTPVLHPPLAFFRELLAMTSAQREQHLAQWTPEKRARLLAKISEYEAMTPSAREESLTATELHWYLQQFLLKSSTNSGIDLSQVPEPYHQMVSDRLNMWRILPPPLQQDVLAHETTRDFFLLGGRARTNLDVVRWQMIPPPLRQELFRLDVLPPVQRQQSYARFQGFFELTTDEKKAVLNTLPAVERQQLEKTIADLNHLPPEQRNLALRSLGQLAGCNEQQRSEFFKNLGRWKQLSPDEQQLWLKLASHLPPMPPMPPPLPPIRSHAPPIPGLSSAARPSP